MGRTNSRESVRSRFLASLVGERTLPTLVSAVFLKEEQADLSAVAIAELTFSMSFTGYRFFRRTVREERLVLFTVLPFASFTLKAHYSGRAAILWRERPGAFLVPSHRPFISSWTYRLALPFDVSRQDEVGFSPVNVVSLFVEAMPPVTLEIREL